MTVRRTFWILSIANWLLAVAVWSVSAYLGIARPTSLFIPTTLFVVGIFAVLAGTLCWVVARFGRPPEPAAATAGEATAAAAQAEAPVAEPARATTTAAEAAVSPAAVSPPAEDAVPPTGEPATAAEQPLPADAG